MMVSIIGACPGDEEDFAELNRMTNEQLRERLNLSMQNTREAILDTARCVRVLEDRGENLSALDTQWFRLIRLVAYGQILPDLILKIQDRTIFEKVAKLPIPEQRRIVNDEPIPVAILDPETDEIDHRLLTVQQMTKNERQQVFGRGFIRSLPDQAIELQRKRMPKPESVITLHLSAKQNAKACQRANRLGITVGELVMRALEAQDYI